ncbi:hypothetical protein TrLO_g13800 [Triparma laevis f. longispina]|uniref:Uncharacterized protein n=1 Tax=Triparma laevis f. longispina TaxID=1714387 RepID=A0A9W7KT46_9STRA|nr:hypothetical protein TrLO_g13800 [Triparma laevis f. longispina]
MTPLFASRVPMSMRKGRPGTKQTLGKKSPSSPGGAGSGGLSGGDSGTWKKTPSSTSDLPQTDGEITLLDTQQSMIIDKATNPTGAVCVGKFDEKLYSFQVNCECCKVPLNKANLLPPLPSTSSPRLSCSFCGATYSLKNGTPIDDATGDGVGGNMFGGIVKNLMGSKERRSLKVYALAEEGGRVMINIPRGDLQL